MFDKIVQLVSFFFFGLAVWLITKEVEKVGFDNLMHLVLSTPLWVILLSCVFIAADYLALTGYDWTALEYINKPLPFKTVFKTASIGFSISNTAGHAYASGGAVRYLFYRPLGLTRMEILTLIAFESLTLFLGMALVYVMALALEPFVGALRHYPYLNILYLSGILVCIAFFAYWVIVIRRKRSLKLGNIQIQSPSPQMTLKQLFVGFCDNFSLFLVFYTLVDYHIPSSPLVVFVIFMVAQTIALTSQVPGGMGVFEGLILYLFPHTLAQKGGLMAGLVAFRVLYFFIPFILSGLYIGLIELQKFWSQRQPQ